MGLVECGVVWGGLCWGWFGVWVGKLWGEGWVGFFCLSQLSFILSFSQRLNVWRKDYIGSSFSCISWLSLFMFVWGFWSTEPNLIHNSPFSPHRIPIHITTPSLTSLTFRNTTITQYSVKNALLLIKSNQSFHIIPPMKTISAPTHWLLYQHAHLVYRAIMGYGGECTRSTNSLKWTG